MTTKSPWEDDVSVAARFPDLSGKPLQVVMRNLYVMKEGERKRWFRDAGAECPVPLLIRAPDNRMLIRDNVNCIRKTLREVGLVTGGRSEIIVVSARGGSDTCNAAADDAEIDEVLAGQHTVAAFYEEHAHCKGSNENINATLAEGIAVTRLHSLTPRFARKKFRDEKIS